MGEDIHRMLTEIRDQGIRTAQDVTWIKEGMERGEKRMDGHDATLGSINSRVSRMQGSSTVYGGFAGAIFAGLVAFFTRSHT